MSVGIESRDAETSVLTGLPVVVPNFRDAAYIYGILNAGFMAIFVMMFTVDQAVHPMVLFAHTVCCLCLNPRRQNGQTWALVNWHIFLIFLCQIVLYPFYFYDDYLVNPVRDATSQTLLIANRVLLITQLAIAGIKLGGLIIFSRSFGAVNEDRFRFPQISTYKCSLIALFCVALSRFYHPAETIITAAYTAESANVGGFGMVEGIYGILLLMLFNDLLCYFSVKKFIIFSSAFLLAVGWFAFMRGARVEGVGLIIGIIFLTRRHVKLFPLPNQGNESIVRWAMRRFMVPTAIIALLIIHFIGNWRSDIAEGRGLLGAIGDLAQISNLKTVNYALATWADVSYTGMVTISLIDKGVIDFCYGETYLNIVLSTVPSFIWPDRPAGFGDIIGSHVSVGGGSLYPVAFYWNFGLLGVSILSVLFGVFMALVSSARSGAFRIFIFAIIATASLRTSYYSQQSLYKYIIATVLLVAVVHFIVPGKSRGVN